MPINYISVCLFSSASFGGWFLHTATRLLQGMWEAIRETKQTSAGKENILGNFRLANLAVFGGACYILSVFCLPHGYGIPYHCHGVRSSYLAEYCSANMESKGSILALHRVAMTVGWSGAHQCPVATEEREQRYSSIRIYKGHASVSLSHTF